MIVKVLVSSFISLLVIITIKVSEAQNDRVENLTQECLACICEAASRCNHSVGCQRDICGPFHITQDYWSDAGRPLLHGQSYGQSLTDCDAFENCVNDPECAARAVQGYMNRFHQDCNNDGKIDCDDFVRVHFLGGNGCFGELLPVHEAEYKACRSIYSE